MADWPGLAIGSGGERSSDDEDMTLVLDNRLIRRGQQHLRDISLTKKCQARKERREGDNIAQHSTDIRGEQTPNQAAGFIDIGDSVREGKRQLWAESKVGQKRYTGFRRAADVQLGFWISNLDRRAGTVKRELWGVDIRPMNAGKAFLT